MKVRVCYTVEVDDTLRCAIGVQWHDEDRPASRDLIQEWFRQNGTEAVDDVLTAYEGHLIAKEYDRKETENQ